MGQSRIRLSKSTISRSHFFSETILLDGWFWCMLICMHAHTFYLCDLYLAFFRLEKAVKMEKKVDAKRCYLAF